MSTQASQLGAFIHALRGRVVRFELFRRTSRIQGSKYEPIRPYDFDESTSVDELAAQVLAHAQDDVNEIGSGGVYILNGEDESGDVVKKREFKVGAVPAQATPMAGGGGIELAEGANGVSEYVHVINNHVALINTLTRHLENKERIAAQKDKTWFDSHKILIDSFLEQNQRLVAQNEKHEERAQATMALREELLSQQHQRNLETKKADHRQELAERTLARIEPAIPAIINRIAGVPLIAAEYEAPMDAFFFSLTPEQMDVFAAAMTPEQRAVFGMMGSELAKRRAKHDAAEAAKHARNGEVKNGEVKDEASA